MNPYLSVIIPVYNGEEFIVDTINKVLDYLKKQSFSYEIIVVSDGSKDKSAEIIKQEFANNSSVRLIDRKENHGKGYTVREGILSAKGQIRLFMDDDNSTAITHFDLMKPLFDEGYDVVIGSRDPKDAKGARQAVSQKWYKRMLGNMGNLFIQALAVPGIWDTQCGFKAFTANAALNIFNKSKIDRWSFDIEVLALARLFKYKIGIVPVYWVNNFASRLKFSAYIEVLMETVKINRYISGLKKEMKKEFIRPVA